MSVSRWPALLTALVVGGTATMAAPAQAAPSPTQTSPATASPVTPRASTAYDDRVIFQSFSLFQPYESTLWSTLAEHAPELKNLGITDFWLPPAYRSFDLARYKEGYAATDRYDLGEFNQGPGGARATKYGTSDELKSLMSTLHTNGQRGQMDLVPNQVMGMSGREAVIATRSNDSGQPWENPVTGQTTKFVNQPYLAYTKGGGQGQATYGRIKSFDKTHFNGTSLQQIGYADLLRDPDGKPYFITEGQPQTNLPSWLPTPRLGINHVDGYLSSRDAYEATAGNWRPLLINVPAFVSYAKAHCGFSDYEDLRTGDTGQRNIWQCRDDFIASTEGYNAWGEEPSLLNSRTGIDHNDQLRFAGHDHLNENIGGVAEMLVGNDLDTANPTVAAEQRHWVKWMLDTYGFDGFRVDAAGHVTVPTLDMVAEETAEHFGGDPAKYLNYLETYNFVDMNRYLDHSGQRQLSYDSQGYFAMRETLGWPGSRPLLDPYRSSTALLQGDRIAGGAVYRPNWSFVSNHDQEKDNINALMMNQLGLIESPTWGLQNHRSFEREWTQAKQDRAVSTYLADVRSTEKRWSPKNVPGQYAMMLTNAGTTPTVYYGDLYETNAPYMQTKSIYHDEITALLEARKKFAKGDQRTYSQGDRVTASVRTGTGRADGLATVLSNDPGARTTIAVPMGRDHANQAYVDVTGKNNQTLVTDGQGTLQVPVTGVKNPEVWGYLGVWAPQDTREVAAVHGQIAIKWNQVRNLLGQPTSGEYCTLRAGGCFQKFENGSIYWSPATGAHFLRGVIAQKWAASNWENGPLGYPTSDELCGMVGGGCRQHFERGSIYWSPATGAHTVVGAIGDAWARTGWEAGWMGYPTTDEQCGLRGGGCKQSFTGGAIYWSLPTGAHGVRGSIAERYVQLGAQNSPLAYPITDEQCGFRDGGCLQKFSGENGSIYWSPFSGAWSVQGIIFQHWGANGWENGRYGYPVGPERCGPAGSDWQCTQSFQRGTITWNSRFGVR